MINDRTRVFRKINAGVPEEHQISVSGSIDPDNINLALQLIEDHDLLGAEIRMSVIVLTPEERSERGIEDTGTYCVVPYAHRDNYDHEPGVGETIDEALQNWHDKRYAKLYGSDALRDWQQRRSKS